MAQTISTHCPFFRFSYPQIFIIPLLFSNAQNLNKHETTLHITITCKRLYGFTINRLRPAAVVYIYNMQSLCRDCVFGNEKHFYFRLCRIFLSNYILFLCNLNGNRRGKIMKIRTTYYNNNNTVHCSGQ